MLADSNNHKLETKDLPDWLEPKKTQEDKTSNYTQERVTPTEELLKHRRSSSDKINQDVSNIIDITVIFFYLQFCITLQVNIQENETNITESLPREKERFKKFSVSQNIENNKIEKRKIEQDYPKVSSNNISCKKTKEICI